MPFALVSPLLCSGRTALLLCSVCGGAEGFVSRLGPFFLAPLALLMVELLALHPGVSSARLWGGPVRARGQVGLSLPCPCCASLTLPLEPFCPRCQTFLTFFFVFRTKRELCPQFISSHFPELSWQPCSVTTAHSPGARFSDPAEATRAWVGRPLSAPPPGCPALPTSALCPLHRLIHAGLTEVVAQLLALGNAQAGRQRREKARQQQDRGAEPV